MKKSIIILILISLINSFKFINNDSGNNFFIADHSSINHTSFTKKLNYQNVSLYKNKIASYDMQNLNSSTFFYSKNIKGDDIINSSNNILNIFAIISMCTLSSICCGIILNAKYGRYYVNVKTTSLIGLATGSISALIARLGNNREKLSWINVIPYTSIYFGTLVLTQFINININTVESGLAGLLMPGILITSLFMYHARKPICNTDTEQNKVINFENISDNSNDLVESGKIILTTAIASITYGIAHDMVTANVNFDYFSGENNHGIVTKKYFPAIYKSKNKFLYATLWGTIASLPLGVLLGTVWALAARCHSYYNKLTWRDLIMPTSIMMGANFIGSMITGLITYEKSNTFHTVACMHDYSYISAYIGGLLMTYLILFNFRSLKETSSSFVSVAPNGISLDFWQLNNSNAVR